MERQAAIDRLPVAYRHILTWLDEGRSSAEIADALDIDPEAVEPLITLAHAKLARLLATHDDA